jgi:hypothetical protein
MCEVIRAAGGSKAVDVDNLLQRQSLDVIGRVGFNHNFRAVEVSGPVGEQLYFGSA